MSILPWWHDKRLGIDIESSGVDVFNDRIVTCSVVYLAGVLRPKVSTWVIDPKIPIPDEAANIHGWTTERVKAYPKVRDPGSALFEIVGRIALAMNRSPDMPLVGMNVPFDLTMLDAECRRHGVDPLSSRLDRGLRPVLDPMVLDKQSEKRRRGKRTLVALCAHYGVLLGDAHSADADAVAACRLVPRIVEKHKKLQSFSVEDLHDLQVGWRAEQQASLAEYFRSQGKDASDVNGEWPLQSAPVVSGVSS